MIIKEGIHLNSIYQHYKGALYKTLDVVYDHENGTSHVLYSKCDKNGVYISIRQLDHKKEEIIIGQPFIRSVVDFKKIIKGMSLLGSSSMEKFEPVEIDIEVPRFKFIKEL